MVTIDNGRDQSMQSLDITAGPGGDKGVSLNDVISNGNQPV